MYIANRPVRFDRNYAIGEIIPDNVIDPKEATRLINTGRIIRFADPAQEKPTEKEPEKPRENPGSSETVSGVKITGEVVAEIDKEGNVKPKSTRKRKK